SPPASLPPPAPPLLPYTTLFRSLDMLRYDAEMEGELYLQRVREQVEGGERSGVRGTPTFFLNGTVQDVSFGLQALFEKVKAESPDRKSTRLNSSHGSISYAVFCL